MNWNRDSDQADKSEGGGVRVGFNLVKFLELDFHGTYYSCFETDILGQIVEVKAKPVDGGLRFNLLPDGPVKPYVGAGVTLSAFDRDTQFDGIAANAGFAWRWGK